MANSNNIDGTINTTNSQILGAGLNLPAEFNNSREGGKLEILLNYNGNAGTLHNKYSFKTVPKSQRPGQYTTIGTNKSNFEMGIYDVKRMANFSISGPGIKFLGRQLLLQGMNAFNETKLYNPGTPVLGAASLASLGLIDRPIRFVEPNLSGVLGALGLKSVSSLFGKNFTPTPPKGTVGETNDLALPYKSAGGKGLIRGKTATDANQNFKNIWGSGGNKFSLMGLIKSTGQFMQANTAVGTFIPIGQPNNEKFKVGEKTYGVFLSDARSTTGVKTGFGAISSVFSILSSVPFVGSIASSVSKTLGLGGSNTGRLFVGEQNYSYQKYSAGAGIGGIDKQTYRDNVKRGSDEVSEIKGTISAFAKMEYPSNFNGKNDPDITKTRQVLSAMLNYQKNTGYELNTDNTSYIAQSYNSLIGAKQSDDVYKSPENYNNSGKMKSYSKNYKNNKSLLKTRGMETYAVDKINMMGIMKRNDNGEYVNGYPTNIAEKNQKYDPEKDDLIKFFFHDVVNDRYVPFRATVKGIQETLQSTWETVKYINRADNLYTYAGFNRTLNFSFVVVVTSVKELLPVWKRINYLAGMTKPANYTTGTIYSRFIIPPLMEFTIGDMYKNQPGVITQIGISIPDDATWETLSEEYASEKQWTYLNDRIKWVNSKNRFAQFPNQCEISVTMNLLEKELSHTGGSNYGDYFLNSDQSSWLGTSGEGSFSDGIYTNNIGTPDKSENAQEFEPEIKAPNVIRDEPLRESYKLDTIDVPQGNPINVNVNTVPVTVTSPYRIE